MIKEKVDDEEGGGQRGQELGSIKMIKVHLYLYENFS